MGQRYVDVDLRDDLFGYEGTSDDQVINNIPGMRLDFCKFGCVVETTLA